VNRCIHSLIMPHVCLFGCYDLRPVLCARSILETRGNYIETVAPARRGLYIIYDPPFRKLRLGQCVRMQRAELEGGARGGHAISHLYRHTSLLGSTIVCVSIRQTWFEAYGGPMSPKPHRSRTSSVSSIGSFATTPDSLSIMGDKHGTSSGPRGVGLSDPTQSASRRRILEIIDRMRATG